MNTTTRALGTLFAATMLITGCGGGGGGESASSDPSPAASPTPAPTSPAAPTSASPLKITTGNAANVAGLVPSLGESVLTVAQFATDSVRRFALRGTTSPSTATCPNGGLLTLTLTDRDADGIATAGDRVTVEARDCAVPVVTDVVTGKMHIDLSAPTGLPAGSLRAVVDLVDGLLFGTSTAETTRLLGSMRFDWSSSGVETALHVTSSTADDLRIVVGFGSNAPLTESIRQHSLSKTLKYDEARSVISLSFRYESQALAGSVTVTTPEPLRAYLNTYPEAGRVDVAGSGGARVSITPNFVNNSNQFQYALDSNGDGTSDSIGSINWPDSTVGYLWWDNLTALNGWNTNVYPTRGFATTDFGANATFQWSTSSANTVRLQFSRPLASTTPTLYFRFADRGGPTYDGTPAVDIAGSAEVRGALVVVSPTKPLRHARSYALQTSLDGTNWNVNVTLQDTLGNSTGSNQWFGLLITTPDNLRAVAVAQGGVLLAASDQLLLSAQSSTSTARPIVAYQWSQLSGTPLRFDNAASAQTQLSWGASAPSTAEAPVIQLTVTDSAGDTDTTQLTVQTVDVAGSSRVLYFRSAAGDYIGGGRVVALGDASGSFGDTYDNGYLRTFFYGNGNNVSFWNLQLATPNGAPLTVGAYENAIRAPFRGAQNGIDFSYGGSGCNQIYGRFDVLEIQLDGAGKVLKFAADFEQHCESQTAPPLLGSYRVNSNVPIRR